MRALVRYQRYFNAENQGDTRIRTTLSASAIRARAASFCGSGWGCIPVLTRKQFAILGGYRNHYGTYVPAGDYSLPLWVYVEGDVNV